MFCKCTECENRGGFSCPRQLELQNCTTPHYLDTLNSSPFYSPPMPTFSDLGFWDDLSDEMADIKEKELNLIKKHLKRFPTNTVKAGFILVDECIQNIKTRKLILKIRTPRKTADEKTETFSECYIQYESPADLGRALLSHGQLVICDIKTSEVIEIIGL